MYQSANYNESFDNGMNLSVRDERDKKFNQPPFGNFSSHDEVSPSLYDTFTSTSEPVNVSLPKKYKNEYNAKIYLPQGQNLPNYELYSGSNDEQMNFNNSLTGIIEMNDVSLTFFNKNNIDKIQKMIIQKVYEESEGQYVVGRQSDLQLQIIMRSVYLTYSINSPDDIEGQVLHLNKITLNECMTSIMPNIKQYLNYRKDISTPRHILSHPVNPSSKGEKTFSLLNI